MLDKPAEIKSLRSKVRSLLDETAFSDADFVRWLATYAQRGSEVMADRGVESHSADDLRDYSSNLRSFASDQAVVDFCHAKGILLKDGVHHWWLNPDNRTGRIAGFDGTANPDRSWGTPRITNGIDVWIERPDGTVFVGHRDWLRYDKRSKDVTKNDANGQPLKATKPAKATPIPAKYLEMAQRMIDTSDWALLRTKCEQAQVTWTTPEAPTVAELGFQIQKYMDYISTNI